MSVSLGDHMRARVTFVFVAFFAGWVWLDGRAQTNAPIVSGAHRFEKVADGIFYATASGTMSVGSNSPIIVSGDEALVIDSGEWRQITDFGDRPTFIARRVSWSSDGRSIFAAVGEGDSDVVLLEGLLNR